MKKIAIIINGDLTKNRQGQINSALSRAKHLRGLGGFEIDFFCIQEYDSFVLRLLRRSEKPSFKHSYEIEGQKIYVIYKHATLFELLYQKVFKRRSFVEKLQYRCLCKQFKGYDMLSGHAIVGGIVANTTSKLYDIPYSVTWHGSDIHTYPLVSYDNKCIINNIIQHASSNIFVSMSLLNTCMSIFKGCPSPHILYNAPDSRFFRYDEAKKKDLRRKFNVGDSKVVAFVGNLVNVKNVFTLPDIFKKVYEQCPETTFWVVGDGYNRLRLEKEITTTDVSCKFFGNLQPESMPDIMNCIDVLVLPSKNESFGMVLVEAIACGANAVGANVGGIPEVIGRNNCFDLNDSFCSKISNRICDMLTNSVAQYINPDFDWMATAKAEKSIYTNIVNNDKHDC